MEDSDAVVNTSRRRAIQSGAAALASLALAGFGGSADQAAEASGTGSDDSSGPSRSVAGTEPPARTYHIDPTNGNDRNTGLSPAQAWQTFHPLSAFDLVPGDIVNVSPGAHPRSLIPRGAGTAEHPVTIHFSPGHHEFGVDHAVRRAYFISNSADDPTSAQPIGILLERARFFRLMGGGVSGAGRTDIVYMGRMTQFVLDTASNISICGLSFDLARPTVSEFRVIDVQGNVATIKVAEGSTYTIADGSFRWTGDLGSGGEMTQEADLSTGHSWRRGTLDLRNAIARDQGDRVVTLTYPGGGMALTPGHQYHFRNIHRDVATASIRDCTDIVFHDCNFYALTGMGIVSQFCENIAFQRVNFAPPADTIRTCPAWADCLHFSSCKGRILVDTCVFSGAQDDPLNTHGINLRIIQALSGNRLAVRFMHPQTYGYAPFRAGDEVAVINHSNLGEYRNNPRRRVLAVTPSTSDSTGKEWTVTLDGAVPTYGADDCLENLTWYPNVTIRNCSVAMSAARGFLVTTRGIVLVERCTFNRCDMASILIEGDAEGWYESGSIRNMTIRHNRFISQGIQVSPSVSPSESGPYVHRNVVIENNFFSDAGVTAKCVDGIRIRNNRSPKGRFPIKLESSVKNIVREHNELVSLNGS